VELRGGGVSVSPALPAAASGEMGDGNPPVEAGSYLVASEIFYEFNDRDLKLRKGLLYKLARHRFAAGQCDMRSTRSEIGVERFDPFYKIEVHRLGSPIQT
jgi:hypothetical protein